MTTLEEIEKSENLGKGLAAVILLVLISACCLSSAIGGGVDPDTLRACAEACGDHGMHELDDRHCVCESAP